MPSPQVLLLGSAFLVHVYCSFGRLYCSRYDLLRFFACIDTDIRLHEEVEYNIAEVTQQNKKYIQLQVNAR